MATVAGGGAPSRRAVIAFSPPRAGSRTRERSRGARPLPGLRNFCARVDALVGPRGQAPRGRFAPRDAARRPHADAACHMPPCGSMGFKEGLWWRGGAGLHVPAGGESPRASGYGRVKFHSTGRGRTRGDVRRPPLAPGRPLGVYFLGDSDVRAPSRVAVDVRGCPGRRRRSTSVEVGGGEPPLVGLDGGPGRREVRRVDLEPARAVRAVQSAAAPRRPRPPCRPRAAPRPWAPPRPWAAPPRRTPWRRAPRRRSRRRRRRTSWRRPPSRSAPTWARRARRRGSRRDAPSFPRGPNSTSRRRTRARSRAGARAAASRATSPGRRPATPWARHAAARPASAASAVVPRVATPSQGAAAPDRASGAASWPITRSSRGETLPRSPQP